MDAATRALVWARAEGRCEYCRVHQDHVELSHHTEHIVARKRDGSDNPSNLCVACARCNLFKGSDLTGIDPATGQVERYGPMVMRVCRGVLQDTAEVACA